MEAIQGLAGAAVGFWFYTLFSKPGKFFHPKVPHIKIRAIEILPNFKINFQKRALWIHHWITLSLILAFLSFRVEGITHLLLIKSFCLGGALQGVTFRDRLKVLVTKSKS